jgi:hypothetical protein
MLKYMLRFVLLLHETPPGYPRHTHYDLMLERAGVLWTWALDRLPAAGQAGSAERLPDHRLAYLDYEGEVAAGRGRVSRVDQGEFEIAAESEERLVIALRGQALRGTLTLEQSSGEPHRWRVLFEIGDATSSPD